MSKITPRSAGRIDDRDLGCQDEREIKVVAGPVESVFGDLPGEGREGGFERRFAHVVMLA